MSLPQGPNPYTVLSHELLHQRPYVRFHKDMVKMGDLTKDYSYAEIDSGIGIVTVNEKSEVALVGQWRYPIHQFLWEIPAGMQEQGEEPVETARRELKEEAGVSAKKWIPLGEYFMEASKTSQKSYVFLAQDLELGDQSLMPDERLELRWIPFQEALEMIERGELQDSLTVIGLLRAQAYLRN